jgi:hypothetical protein
MPTRFPPDPSILAHAALSIAAAVAIVVVIDTLIWAFGESDPKNKPRTRGQRTARVQGLELERQQKAARRR